MQVLYYERINWSEGDWHWSEGDRDGVREGLPEEEAFLGILKVEKVIHHVKWQERISIDLGDKNGMRNEEIQNSNHTRDS